MRSLDGMCQLFFYYFSESGGFDYCQLRKDDCPFSDYGRLLFQLAICIILFQVTFHWIAIHYSF